MAFSDSIIIYWINFSDLYTEKVNIPLMLNVLCRRVVGTCEYEKKESVSKVINIVAKRQNFHSLQKKDFWKHFHKNEQTKRGNKTKFNLLHTEGCLFILLLILVPFIGMINVCSNTFNL